MTSKVKLIIKDYLNIVEKAQNDMLAALSDEMGSYSSDNRLEVEDAVKWAKLEIEAFEIVSKEAIDILEHACFKAEEADYNEAKVFELTIIGNGYSTPNQYVTKGEKA